MSWLGWVRHLHQHPALSAAQNDLPEAASEGGQGLLWDGRHRGQRGGGDQQQQDQGVDLQFSSLEFLQIIFYLKRRKYFANEMSCSASKEPNNLSTVGGCEFQWPKLKCL